MATQRHTIPFPDEMNAVAGAINALNTRANYAVLAYPNIANATTAGKLKTQATVTFSIAGTFYSKASADNFFDFTGETATGSAVYRAYWLYVASDGSASIAAGTDSASLATAIKALPTPDTTKSIFGVFVAGPSTTFTNALTSQGTLYNGLPIAALPHWSDATQSALPLTYVAA